MVHVGISPDDPRNAGIIEHLRPKPITIESVVANFAAIAARKSRSELEADAKRVLDLIGSKPHRPSPPLSQPIEKAPHPWFGLNTRPDIFEPLWKLDERLPQRCRGLLWGYPALVHPNSGVVFAVAIGTIGAFLRLSSDALTGEEITFAGPHYLSPVGPEWSRLDLRKSLLDYVQRAYKDVE
jgi:hypothetical protein